MLFSYSSMARSWAWRFALLALPLLCSLLAPASPALAFPLQCVTSGGNETCTNSGSVVGNFGDTIAGAGNITTTNSGSVSGNEFAQTTTGNATTINSGTVAGAEYAVAGSGNATVINYGTIGSFSGVGIAAVLFGNGNATVTNYGSVAGQAQASIDGGFGSVAVTNFGIIGSNVVVEVTNNFSGKPSTATMTNFGTVAGSVTAFIGDSGNILVTNFGRILGGVSITFDAFGSSGNATLTNYAGSSIIGAITLAGAPNAYLNFVGGNFHYTLNSLSGVTINASGAPFAVSGNTVATIDPTPFAANGRVLGDFTRSASQAVPDFGNQPAATSGGPIGYAAASSSPASVVSSAFDNMPGHDAYAADQAVFKAPTVVQADGTAIWARGFGGYRVQQGDGGVLLRTSSTFYGGAIGFEKQLRSDLRVGAFAGGGTTRSTVDLNMGDTNSNLGFGGLYARYFVGASFLYAAIQGGGSHNDTTRNINNNLAANGIETAKGSYGGWYVSPELKLGHHIALGRVVDSSYTLTPSLGVRYLYGSFGGYTETGSTANLTVNSQTAQSVEERAELKLTRTTQFNATSALLIDVTGGALGIQRVGSNIVNAALLGQSIPFATPGKDDVWGGFGGAGMEWRTGNVALFASGEYLWLSDSSTIVSGKGGVRVAF